MKLYSTVGIAIVFCCAAVAQTRGSAARAETVGTPPAAARSGVAVIQFQQAVLATQQGRQAMTALDQKFATRKAELQKKQTELAALQDKIQKGSATLSAEARAKLESDLSSGTRDFNRAVEDVNSEAQQEQGKALQPIATQLATIIKSYAPQHGYSVVLDVSNPQTSSVLWAAESVNITPEIVKLYDQAHPANTAAAPAAPAAKPPAAPARK